VRYGAALDVESVIRLMRIRLHLAIYFLLYKRNIRSQAARRQALRSRLLQLALVLVRFDHVASFIVNANHSIV